MDSVLSSSHKPLPQGRDRKPRWEVCRNGCAEIVFANGICIDCFLGGVHALVKKPVLQPPAPAKPEPPLPPPPQAFSWICAHCTDPVYRGIYCKGHWTLLTPSFCAREGCRKLIAAGDYCKEHYEEWWKERTRKRGQSGCLAAEVKCNRSHKSHGLCERHYSQFRKHGDTSYLLPRLRLKCRFPDCGRYRGSGGYCSTHAAQLRATGKTRAIRPSKMAEYCSMPRCGQPHHAKGYCHEHYGKFLRRKGRTPHPVCAHPGCERRTTEKYCKTHRRQFLKHGRTTDIRTGPVLCEIPQCGGIHRNTGLCRRHTRVLERLVRRMTEDFHWPTPEERQVHAIALSHGSQVAKRVILVA